MDEPGLSKPEIDEALADLDNLCIEEYGYGMDDLLTDPDEDLAALRLQRLSGILLKRQFGHPVPITWTGRTRSLRAWEWDLAKFGDPRLAATPEYEVLDELRRDLPRQMPYHPGNEPTFQELKDEAEHERGLFKVLTLWVGDKLNKEQGRSFKEYLETEESPRLEAALDAGTTVLQSALAPILLPFLPVPAVVVSLIVIGVKFGYRTLTDVDDRGDLGT